jgi:adenine-specific DNA methylase
MLLALLLPDPEDPLCPEDFKARAAGLLSEVKSSHAAGANLRAGLLRFIGDFASWDVASNPLYMKVARELILAAHPLAEPLVVDPFAGGGSIPLEALRLGCDTFASDLNPVAVLIEKVMFEDVPRLMHQETQPSSVATSLGQDGLAVSLRNAGSQIRGLATQELADVYPLGPSGERPITYLWARTVVCESPKCGAEIPLVRSFWLSKKKRRRRALRPKVIGQKQLPPQVDFEIFAPTKDSEVATRTVQRATATCLCCHTTMAPDRVRAQLRAQKGGADVIFNAQGKRTGGARLLAVVSLNEEQAGRQYRLPNQQDYEAVWRAKQQLSQLVSAQEENELAVIPDEPTPVGGGSGAGRAFSVQSYGMMQFQDMFTARQNLALATLARHIRGSTLHPRLLTLALGKLVDLSNVMCPWEPEAECPRNVLSLGRIKPSWDFAEGVPISDSSGGFVTCIDNLVSGILSIKWLDKTATAEVAPAQRSPLASDACMVWFTDPPYYDAIPYADLSDMFFVWYKRALTTERLLHDPFDKSNPLTPKDLEATQDDARLVKGHPKDKRFFEDTMTEAFAEGYRLMQEDAIGCVVFAHKTTEGWEALLTGMARAPFVITGSWPIATEQRYRLRARDAAALETSVHLVFRPRAVDAPVGDWMHVSRELPRRIGEWMGRLQNEGVRGADLVFACIGPALEVYSRYSKVVDSEDREIPLGGDPEASQPHLRGFLAYVWEVVGRLALEQILGTDDTHAAATLEEDARLTALFLWTRETANQVGEKSVAETDETEDEASADEDEEEARPRRKQRAGYSLPFDVVRRIAQPLGIHLPEWEDRILNTEKGVVTLLPVKDRARQLFGSEGANAFATEIEEDPSRPLQMTFLKEANSVSKARGGRRGKKSAAVTLDDRRDATTLDRLHAAMLLQKNGQTPALRALLKAETDRGPGFMRLANSLSALYPRGSEEKRWLDALLVNMKR